MTEIPKCVYGPIEYNLNWIKYWENKASQSVKRKIDKFDDFISEILEKVKGNKDGKSLYRKDYSYINDICTWDLEDFTEFSDILVNSVCSCCDIKQPKALLSWLGYIDKHHTIIYGNFGLGSMYPEFQCIKFHSNIVCSICANQIWNKLFTIPEAPPTPNLFKVY